MWRGTRIFTVHPIDTRPLLNTVAIGTIPSTSKGLIMTTNTELKTAGRAAMADLQSLAAQGVERALAARRMTELSAEQVQAVSGGASIYLPVGGHIINGKINPEIIRNLQLSQIKQLEIAQLGNVVLR
jgi:hypothetical protein